MPDSVDYYTLLEEFVPTIDNLPNELGHVFTELINSSNDLLAIEQRVKSQDNIFKKQLKTGINEEWGDDLKIYQSILGEYEKNNAIQKERIDLVERIRDLVFVTNKVDKHLKKLSTELDKLYDLDPNQIKLETQTPIPKRRIQPPVRSLPMKKKKRETEDEQLYCTCHQVSYGEMIACDGKNCMYEWYTLVN
ncbi:Histone acetyltransferase complex subunit [Boothiomyces sp. JEL0838]|nr:Histone acetyltransferase complex subunit [Boothiomyces sp. JEL0838]